MSKHPSTEALEGAHTFPGPYVFKLFGPHDQSFIDSIRAHIEGVIEDASRYTLAMRASSKGAHCVVDVSFQANDAGEVQRLYTAFHDVEGLKTML